MALPTSRDLNYSPGATAVSAANLDNIQDQIISFNTFRVPWSVLTDQVHQMMVGSVSNSATRAEMGGDDGANPSTLWAYTLDAGHAFLRQGSANHKIQIAPGTLFQKVANSDGVSPTFLPFTFAGTEEWTLTNGDATNPRVDLLQMRIQRIVDSTQCVIQTTLNVKAGTPAASPTVPDPDAGFVPVGSVVVGHGWTTSGNAPIFGVDTAETNNLVVHDQRMPMRVSPYLVTPSMYHNDTAWTFNSTRSELTATSGTNTVWWRCPRGAGRLVAADLYSSAGTSVGTAVTFGAFTIGNSDAGAIVRRNTFTGANSVINGARSLRIHIDGAHSNQIGPLIQQSSSNKIGVPLWTSGDRVPRTVAGSPHWLAMQIINIANATALHESIFYIAT